MIGHQTVPTLTPPDRRHQRGPRHPLLVPRYLVAAALLLVVLALLGADRWLDLLQAEAIITEETLNASLRALRHGEVSALPTVEANLTSARATLTAIEASLPVSIDQLALMDQVEAAATRAGLEVIRLEPVNEPRTASQPGPSATAVIVPALRYRLALAGNETGLRPFLDSLPDLGYPTLAVEAVSSSAKGMVVTLAVNLRPAPVPTATASPRRVNPTPIPSGHVQSRARGGPA